MSIHYARDAVYIIYVIFNRRFDIDISIALRPADINSFISHNICNRILLSSKVPPKYNNTP